MSQGGSPNNYSRRFHVQSCGHVFQVLIESYLVKNKSVFLPPHITETPVRHPQGRYQASSRDLGVSQPPQGVDQLTHPLDTAGEAVSGDPALRRAQTRQSALNLGEY